jgi:hypothetical protein
VVGGGKPQQSAFRAIFLRRIIMGNTSKRPSKAEVTSAPTETYGTLRGTVEKAFQRNNPLIKLGIYHPLAYYIGPDTVDPWIEGRQKQVCCLIRTQFLKRFESSAHAFEESCIRLFVKLLAWAEKHSDMPIERRRLEQWTTRHFDLTGYIHQRQAMLRGDDREEDAVEDLITEEILEQVQRLDRELFCVPEILNDTFGDLDQIVQFLTELARRPMAGLRK